MTDAQTRTTRVLSDIYKWLLHPNVWPKSILCLPLAFTTLTGLTAFGMDGRQRDTYTSLLMMATSKSNALFSLYRMPWEVKSQACLANYCIAYVKEMEP